MSLLSKWTAWSLPLHRTVLSHTKPTISFPSIRFFSFCNPLHTDSTNPEEEKELRAKRAAYGRKIYRESEARREYVRLKNARKKERYEADPAGSQARKEYFKTAYRKRYSDEEHLTKIRFHKWVGESLFPSKQLFVSSLETPPLLLGRICPKETDIQTSKD